MNHLPFHEALEDCSRLAGKVPQALCLDQGDYPVIGQGKQEVDGFTNDSDLVFRGDLPVILFGDHTAAFKFVDRPFARGADGTKLFRPRTQLLDAKFAWHFLQTAKLPDTGYDRKTKYLENLRIPLPPLEEQRRIAAILDKAASLEAAQQQRTELLWRIEASLFGQMSEKSACASKKCTLKDLTADGDKINYGVVQPGNQVDSGIPLIRVGDLVSGGIDRSALKCIDPEIESAYARSRIKGNELLLSCVGSIGTVAEVGPADIGSNIARAVARIPVSEAVNRKWLATCLRSSTIQRYFTNELRTVGQPTLNIKQIEETEINLPPIELQNTFASKLHAVERVCKQSSFSETQTRQIISALQSRAVSGLLQLQ